MFTDTVFRVIESVGRRTENLISNVLQGTEVQPTNQEGMTPMTASTIMELQGMIPALLADASTALAMSQTLSGIVAAQTAIGQTTLTPEQLQTVQTMEAAGKQKLLAQVTAALA